MGAILSVGSVFITLPVTVPLGIYLSNNKNILHVAPFILLASALLILYINYYNKQDKEYIRLEIFSSILSMLMFITVLVHEFRKKH